MIEVNLYSVPAQDSRVGRCIARNRFDKESGMGVEAFVKGFLKDNVDVFEKNGSNALGLVGLINSDITLTRKDVSCINYYLGQAGYLLTINNVADDEENATGVSGDVIEWNVIDKNFIQYDYPTATKIIPSDGMDVVSVLRQIVESSGMFGTDKFGDLKNPFTEIFDNLDRIKNITGAANPALVSKVYELLDNVGIEIFCATSES